MTPERKHIAKFLSVFIEENYDYLSDAAKTDEAVSTETMSKSELIKRINSNEDFLDWFFMEGLRWAIVIGDCLEPLIVENSNDNDFMILQVNHKFIKWWSDNEYQDHFQFVEQKTKLVEVTYYE